MSNATRYDSLLVRDLAAELHRDLAGCRIEDASLDRASLRAGLRLRAARRSDPPPPSLLWNLHPSSGALHRTQDLAGAGGRVQLASPSFIGSVSAPPDERLIFIDLDVRDTTGGVAHRLIIELVTNQWNAVALAADGRIINVLRERRTRERELRAGVPYVAPAPSNRRGRTGAVSLEEWIGVLSVAPPGTRLDALVRGIAYTSPLNAAAILGDADVSGDTGALERAWERYVDIIWNAAAEPCVIRVDGVLQPYSRTIGPGVERVASLLAAIERVSSEPIDAAGLAERALDAVAQKLEATQRRIERMAAQQSGATAEAERLRTHADLLLAQLHRAARGADTVEVDDFSGGVVRIELDPALSGTDNAKRMYDAARKRSRAAERMPRLIAAAEREMADLDRLAERIRNREVDAGTLERLGASRPTSKQPEAPALPYRQYKTTRGLEVRVGRGSRANDALTFRHSSPSDIWLHARDVAGAHVILRWSRMDENPPARDIAEAAALAAHFSRARTSGLVAVDWTRRKWVRKPRKAAPGLVIPERVKTVFVEPDATLEEKLRADASL